MWAQEAGTEFYGSGLTVQGRQPAHGSGCFVRPLPSQLRLCFDHHNYIFVTKLETHLFIFLKMGNYPTLCFVMAPQSLRWPFSMFFYLLKRRQSLLITTNHRIISESELLPLHPSVPPSLPWPPIISLLYWHIVQPPDVWRRGKVLCSCSVLKSACRWFHRKLLEIWRWWSNRSSASAL